MKKDSTTLNFTKALDRLEEIVQKLEDPNLDLEEGITLVEEGVKLHKYCRDRLTEANEKITTILSDKTAVSGEGEVS